MKLSLVLSREFMDNLFIENNSKEKIDLINFFKKDLAKIDLLICDMESKEAFMNAASENPIFEHLLDKFDNIKYEPNLNSEIHSDKFYSQLGEQNIFFLNTDSTTCEKLSSERGYVFISTDNIEFFWRPIMNLRENNTYKVTKSLTIPDDQRFDCWDKLNNLCLPLTSIIIFDRYILKSKTLIENNLFQIIKRMCTKNLKKPVNLTIITNFDDDENVIRSKFELIKKFLDSESFHDVKLNLVRHDISLYPPKDFEGLHSRLIITNILRIKSEDSFNYFKQSGQVTNDSDINFSLVFDKKSKHFYNKELHDIKRYTNNLKKLTQNKSVFIKLNYLTDLSNYMLN